MLLLHVRLVFFFFFVCFSNSLSVIRKTLCSFLACAAPFDMLYRLRRLCGELSIDLYNLEPDLVGCFEFGFPSRQYDDIRRYQTHKANGTRVKVSASSYENSIYRV